MNRKWLIALIGAASAGIAGYGASRYLQSRRKKTPAVGKIEPAAEPGQDVRLSQTECPACGKPVKEYEFFCPYCGYSSDKN